MKPYFLPILAFTLLLLSCTKEEDMTPVEKVEGKYIASVEGPSSWGLTTYIYVNTLEFKSDGTVYGEGTTLDVETEELLGFRYFLNGTYTVMDGEVTIKYQNYNAMNIADLDYMDKDDLISFEELDNAAYEILENYTQLQYKCSTYPDCGTLQIYTKIE